LERDVGDGVANAQEALPLAVTVGRPERERGFDLAAQLRLRLGRRHLVPGLDEARVLFDGEVRLLLDVAEDPRFALGDDLVPELAGRERVSPVAEGALGELHDVALVNERHALSPVRERVLDRRADEPLRSFLRDGLDADSGRLREADLLHAHFLLQELDDTLHFGRARGPLDARVDVLRVLAEDHHVDVPGPLHRARDVGEPADGTQADVQVELLPERDVEGADALAHRRGERAFDADQVLPVRLDGLVGQPAIEALLGLFARVHLVPGDLALALVGLLDGRIQDRAGGTPNVGSRAVALDERDDGAIGNVQLAGLHADGVAGLRFFEHCHTGPRCRRGDVAGRVRSSPAARAW